MKSRKSVSSFFLGCCVGIVVISGLVWSGLLNKNLSAALRYYDFYSLNSGNVVLENLQGPINELYYLIQDQYYTTGAIDPEKMSRQALSAFVGALGDPFSSYLPPQDAQNLLDSVSGDDSIEGIGAILSQTPKGVVVESVVPGSPAEKAGLLPLDTIVQVDDTSTQNLALTDVVGLIRGPQGTNVLLKILRTARDGTSVIKDLSITRDTILVPSITSKIVEEKGIKLGYIALMSFAGDTAGRLQQIAQNFSDQGVSGVILDLRGDGGGLLTEAVSVSSFFLRKGVTVTKAVYRSYNDDRYRAVGNPSFPDIPVIVLIDGYTASASEITTLALRENRCPGSTNRTLQEFGSGTEQRVDEAPQIIPNGSSLSNECSVVLVGERSFGKGTIQSLINLDFGGSLKLTIGKWYSPTGISVDKKGILPDYVVSLDSEQYYNAGIDAQLNKARELLASYISSQK